MNLVDLCIIIMFIFGFFVGWKNGFIKQLVYTLGLVFIFVLAFYFKRPIATLFYRWLPFINFGGSLKEVSVLNIIMYEVLAFIVSFCLFTVIFRIAVKLSNLADKVIKASIIFGFPSKILGGLVGLASSYIVTFIIVFFLNLPLFNLNMVSDSKFAQFALNKTTILSNMCNNTVLLYEEIEQLKDEYKDSDDKRVLNNKILKLLLENKFISKEDVDYLISHGKLKNVDLNV